MPPLQPDMSYLARLHEDIGAMKALVASVDKKMDEATTESRAMRAEQSDLRDSISELKADGDARAETIEALSESVKELTTRVDQLVALRHRVGGALVIISVLSGALYGAWDIIIKVLTVLPSTPK